MTAERLRAAAKVLRERAEAAYTPEALTPWSNPQFEPEPREAWPDQARGYLGGEWGEYVAMMQPPVALALADWLDATAEGINRRGVTARLSPAEREALRVADLILGGES